jgi:preprotein translocase subunit SecG
MGAAFGSGSSGSLFGASGSANFLSHTTAVLAAVFFITSIGLTWYATSNSSRGGVMERSILDKALPATKASDVPVAPATKASDVPAAPATKASDVPAAPAGSAAPQPAGSKAGEVPK